MASSSLTSDFFISLPSEVLLTVFGSQDSFRDIRSLFSTCKTIYTLWQTRAVSISNGLLKQQTPCWEEVRNLVVADEQAHAGIRPKSNVLSMDAGIEERYQSTIYRLTVTRRATAQAKHLCEIIEGRYLAQKQGCREAACRAHPSTLVPRERTEVIRAHHFIKLFALSHSNKQLADTHTLCLQQIAEMQPQEKHLLFQLVRIMHDYALPWDKLRLGIGSWFEPGAVVDFDACCCRSWTERFEALKMVTRTSLQTCGDCLWDDTGVYGGLALERT